MLIMLMMLLIMIALALSMVAQIMEIVCYACNCTERLKFKSLNMLKQCNRMTATICTQYSLNLLAFGMKVHERLFFLVQH